MKFLVVYYQMMFSCRINYLYKNLHCAHYVCHLCYKSLKSLNSYHSLYQTVMGTIIIIACKNQRSTFFGAGVGGDKNCRSNHQITDYMNVSVSVHALSWFADVPRSLLGLLRNVATLYCICYTRTYCSCVGLYNSREQNVWLLKYVLIIIFAELLFDIKKCSP